MKILPLVALALLAVPLSIACTACTAGTSEEDEEEMGVSEAACHELYRGVEISPSLKDDYDKIIHTKTGNDVAKKAKAHHLKRIQASKHGGACKYEDGTITIANADGKDAFASLAKELLHAGGYHPEFVPDKDLVAKICKEAKAKCAPANDDGYASPDAAPYP